MSSLLIVAEHRNGKLKKSSFEAISKGASVAKDLGLSAHVLLIGGTEVAGLTAEAANYGVTSVLTVTDPKLSAYANRAFATAITEAAKAKSASVILLSATSMGRELGAFVSVKLDASFASDCTDLQSAGGTLKVTRPVYTGKALSTVELKQAVKVITLRPNAFPVLSVPATASVESVSVSFTEKDFGSKVVDMITASGKLDVAEAEIVVSGGRSLGSAENFKILEDLAEVLGGAVGASRAAVDSGYRSHEDQVGQTGKVISPKLYIACGISGAIQHLAGMSSSKVIVAINKDKEAPIFQIADYGIVADLFEIVPALTAELKKRSH
ncbi:MAG: electron transfer flavoprotein subunit alpha/FixB family protein [Bacteroidetes bacterium]|nr:electron transfer flavoprotein subunit alpha/FixB family protein [Bacteroidota bacterium]